MPVVEIVHRDTVSFTWRFESVDSRKRSVLAQPAARLPVTTTAICPSRQALSERDRSEDRCHFSRKLNYSRGSPRVWNLLDKFTLEPRGINLVRPGSPKGMSGLGVLL